MLQKGTWIIQRGKWGRILSNQELFLKFLLQILKSFPPLIVSDSLTLHLSEIDPDKSGIHLSKHLPVEQVGEIK